MKKELYLYHVSDPWGDRQCVVRAVSAIAAARKTQNVHQAKGDIVSFDDKNETVHYDCNAEYIYVRRYKLGDKMRI